MGGQFDPRFIRATILVRLINELETQVILDVMRSNMKTWTHQKGFVFLRILLIYLGSTIIYKKATM